MEIVLIGAPTDADWMEVKRRALVTAGLSPITPPTSVWKHDILKARHSPIRYLRYSFLFKEIPYWVAMHLRTHVHDCPHGDEFDPYIKSQRDDRQHEYARGKAPQDQPVNMIIDMSAEQLMVMANKRLCHTASPETQEVVRRMCDLALDHTPEFEGLFVPNCIYLRHCPEMKCCGYIYGKKKAHELGIKSPKNKRYYVVYLRKNEEFQIVGTAKECAEYLGYKTVNNFYCIYWRYQKTKKGRYIIESVEEVDECE